MVGIPDLIGALNGLKKNDKTIHLHTRMIYKNSVDETQMNHISFSGNQKSFFEIHFG